MLQGAEDRRRGDDLGGRYGTPPVAGCYSRPNPPATRLRLPLLGLRGPLGNVPPRYRRGPHGAILIPAARRGVKSVAGVS